MAWIEQLNYFSESSGYKKLNMKIELWIIWQHISHRSQSSLHTGFTDKTDAAEKV